uniref:Uncharacterized protein n=1 Tax=Oncorhynchus mykiss TaxID=8022 RepID=A0A8K9V018_ONCMY
MNSTIFDVFCFPHRYSRACCSFYQALGSEDPQLASDISGDVLLTCYNKFITF